MTPLLALSDNLTLGAEGYVPSLAPRWLPKEGKSGHQWQLKVALG
jgi:hypothetical protein